MIPKHGTVLGSFLGKPQGVQPAKLVPFSVCPGDHGVHARRQWEGFQHNTLQFTLMNRLLQSDLMRSSPSGHVQAQVK